MSFVIAAYDDAATVSAALGAVVMVMSNCRFILFHSINEVDLYGWSIVKALTSTVMVQTTTRLQFDYLLSEP